MTARIRERPSARSAGALTTFFICMGGVVASASATAQEPPGTQAATTAFALLAASCSGCHAEQVSEDGSTSLYGRNAADIRTELLAFKSGEREGTVMNRIARGYSELEIELLSNYIAAQWPID